MHQACKRSLHVSTSSMKMINWCIKPVRDGARDCPDCFGVCVAGTAKKRTPSDAMKPVRGTGIGAHEPTDKRLMQTITGIGWRLELCLLQKCRACLPKWAWYQSSSLLRWWNRGMSHMTMSSGKRKSSGAWNSYRWLCNQLFCRSACDWLRMIRVVSSCTRDDLLAGVCITNANCFAVSNCFMHSRIKWHYDIDSCNLRRVCVSCFTFWLTIGILYYNWRRWRRPTDVCVCCLLNMWLDFMLRVWYPKYVFLAFITSSNVRLSPLCRRTFGFWTRAVLTA